MLKAKKIKHKTHSGAKKRFKKTKSGLIKASHAMRRHILTKKTRKLKRQLRRSYYLDSCDQARIRQLL